jgi:hypothetical protein
MNFMFHLDGLNRNATICYQLDLTSPMICQTFRTDIRWEPIMVNNSDRTFLGKQPHQFGAEAQYFGDQSIQKWKLSVTLSNR